jgi:molybdopterin-containing oxidoreductase family iron-sulfur binding subunit
MSNNLPDKVWWNRILTVGGEAVIDTSAGTYPNCSIRHVPMACQHCENPQCVRVCPVGATYKDEETGVVLQDYDKCIGCRYCMAACPYTGVRQFNWEEPSFHIDFPVGDADSQRHQRNTVEKCTLCSNRIAHGEEPACIEVCPGRARHFGDLDDPASEVSVLIAENSHVQLLPEMETNPSVYYLV